MKALSIITILLATAVHAPAATLFVDLNSTNPIAPYSDWSLAATNIQDAIDASTNGDLILVTNGDYRNRIVTTNAITIQSVNGLGVTIIDGNQTNTCATLADGSTLIGFTLTNGYSEYAGAGVFCASTNAFVFNCLIISNSVKSIYGFYGAVYSGTLSNCTISGNISQYGDGVGAAFAVLNNCTLSGNMVPPVSRGGGAGAGGGAYECTLNRCVLVGNQAAAGGGACACTLNNCLVANNSAVNELSGFASGGGFFGCNATNCTIVNNAVYYYPGFTSDASGGGVSGGTSDNCIIYANDIITNFLVSLNNYSGGTFNNCCTTPLPANGQNNFTNAPLFLNQNGGDFHLQSNSPCINSGNNAYVASATDLNGYPRIVGGTVDMGPYEYQTPASVISYAWLQQYGLSINTNTDNADPDGDGLNNWQEWRAGTDPTNALSVLKMASATPTNNPPGLVVIWQSVSGIAYFLQSGTNLGAQPAFSTIQSNIPGQTGTTSYTDTNAVGSGPYFYRVGVQ